MTLLAAANEYNLEFEVTRDDWLALNRKLIEISPHWEQLGRADRKRQLGHMVWVGPFMVAAIAITLNQVGDTRGMFMVGVGLGVGATLFIAWGLSRLDYADRHRRAAYDRVSRMDLSGAVGRAGFRAHAGGVEMSTPAREVKLTWAGTVPHSVGEYVLFSFSRSDGFIVPKRVFGSSEESAAFVVAVTRWWQEAQLPEPQRVVRYLADRDAACPHCQYNLRGIIQDRCPECGSHLTIAAVMAARQ